jgi:hypothetical protein
VPLNDDHDRYVPYRQAYEAAPVEAAIFHPSEPRSTPGEYEKMIRDAGARYERTEVAGFVVLIVPRR